MSTYPFSVLKQGGNDYQVKCAPKLLASVTGTSTKTMSQLVNELKTAINRVPLKERHNLVLIRDTNFGTHKAGEGNVYKVVDVHDNSIFFNSVSSSAYTAGNTTLYSFTLKTVIIGNTNNVSKIEYSNGSYSTTVENNVDSANEYFDLYSF